MARSVTTFLCPTCRNNKPRSDCKWDHKGKYYCSKYCYTQGVKNSRPPFVPLPRRAPDEAP